MEDLQRNIWRIYLQAMKVLFNTLYVTLQEAYLSKDGECAVINHDHSVVAKVPLHLLQGIVIFGNVTCSPFLLGHCAEKGIAVSWLTEYGKFLATMHGPVSGNVLLRREQYRRADDPGKAAGIASSFIVGKVANCRTILLRANRDNPAPELDQAIDRLRLSLGKLREPLLLDSVRGVEGEAAHVYFSVFSHLIRSHDAGFAFAGRNRRPPRDAVNCLLSFLYTLLAHDVRGALESCGLDPAVGFLHRDRPGRPGLALDVMEEFRAYLADRLACTLINRGQVKSSDFITSESGAVMMDEKTRKIVLAAWQERKQEVVVHPFLQEKVPAGLLLQCQAQLLARHLRGDLDAYPPFVIR